MYNHLGRIADLFTTAILVLLSYVTPRNDSLWVFVAGDGTRFAENSKYLFLHAVERESITPVWIGTGAQVIHMLRAEGYEAHDRYSLRGRLNLLRAGVAVETHGPQFGQFLGGACVVDTHHGNALKKMGDDKNQRQAESRAGKLKAHFHEMLLSPSYFQVTNSGKPLETFTRAKGLDASDVIIAPYPRLDALVGMDDRFELGTNTTALQELREEADDKTIVFYTPTWRRAFGEENGEPLSKVRPDFDTVDSALPEEEFKVYVSSHPREPLEIEYDEYEVVEELDSGGDLYPFLHYCDLLVTDYSSIFYDYAITDDRMIFHAPDLREYEESRGLYFDYHEHVPGPVVTNTTDLIEEIRDTPGGNDRFASERERIVDDFYGGVPSSPSRTTFEKISDVARSH